MIYTYADAVEHAIDFVGGTPDALALRDARKACLAAYRELVNCRIWSFLYEHGRVVTSPPYSTGTVAYDHSGGTYERQLLLSGGTWPDWAGPGSKVRIGVVTSSVLERKSATVLTLDPQVNPGQDLDYNPVAISGLTLATPVVVASVAHGLASGAVVIVEGTGTAADGTWPITKVDADHFRLVGSAASALPPWAVTGTYRTKPTTPYTLYRDEYLLPEDFLKGDTAIFEGNFGGLSFALPTDLLWYQRFTYSAGTPRSYTITGSTLFPDRLAIAFAPYPDLARTIDFIYQRSSRNLRWQSYADGTITCDGSYAVAGHGTAFHPTMAGSILRVGTPTVAPTSAYGTAPATLEALILEVVSPTELRLGVQATPVERAKYVVSDPVDVDQSTMLTAYQRGLEAQMFTLRRMTLAEGQIPPAALYTQALRDAEAADSRNFQGRVMGAPRSRSVPYKYMPANFFPN